MCKDFGIIYVASGAQFMEECNRSARSAKKYMPDVPIALYTEKGADVDSSLFDYVTEQKDLVQHYSVKINPLLDSPFEKSLFVDTDTFFLSDVYELVDLLDHYDMAFAHDPYRFGWSYPADCTVPVCFTEINTGVMAFKKSEAVSALMQEWKNKFEEITENFGKLVNDQMPFRMVLYESQVKFYVLPCEYNMRTVTPLFKGGAMKAKILHGRGPSLDKAIKGVNKTLDIGVFEFFKWPLYKRILYKLRLIGKID